MIPWMFLFWSDIRLIPIVECYEKPDWLMWSLTSEVLLACFWKLALYYNEWKWRASIPPLLAKHNQYWSLEMFDFLHIILTTDPNGVNPKYLVMTMKYPIFDALPSPKRRLFFKQLFKENQSPVFNASFYTFVAKFGRLINVKSSLIFGLFCWEIY